MKQPRKNGFKYLHFGLSVSIIVLCATLIVLGARGASSEDATASTSGTPSDQTSQTPSNKGPGYNGGYTLDRPSILDQARIGKINGHTTILSEVRPGNYMVLDISEAEGFDLYFVNDVGEGVEVSSTYTKADIGANFTGVALSINDPKARFEYRAAANTEKDYLMMDANFVHLDKVIMVTAKSWTLRSSATRSASLGGGNGDIGSGITATNGEAGATNVSSATGRTP